MSNQFQVDQIVNLHSPHTNEDVLVNFLGSMSGGLAMVIPHPKGLGMVVPIDWLSPKAETINRKDKTE